ncbi:AMP-binding protein [Haloarchaeobius sp. TZWWS8]|uniref:AMP-binding protein n=1 Tax=Haloarchaeobius sp. TZWWS8 TaxID=3446121 RepID=UPI003EB8E601
MRVRRSDGGAGVGGAAGRPYDWVGAWSERRAALSPDCVALRDASTGVSYTYAELERRANRTARLLRAHGVERDATLEPGEAGPRVAVVSRNRPELVDLFFATGKTGGVLAPLSHRLASRELAELLADVDPELLVVEGPFDELVRKALACGGCAYDSRVLGLGESGFDSFENELPDDGSRVDTADLTMDDPHLFLHTGGSTGTPKETVLTHGSIVWNSFNTITAWGLRPEDVTPMVFPMFHTGGWNVLTVPFFHLGAEVVIAREFDPEQVLALVDERDATVLVAVPAVLRMMTQADGWADADLDSLRFVKSGGGPCRESVMEEWWSRGVDLSQGYGLTECGPNNFAMPDGWPPEKSETVGVPAMHVDVRIVDADGNEVPAGEIGELELASPHVAAGYWHAPDETAATFGDGWVSTGDLARRDDDGYVSIEGRKKNMFVSGGENVYPSEVEAVVSKHPKVAEVVVVPVHDEQWGQVGKAVVEGDESLTLDELTDFLDGKLARFKRPRQLAFVDEMPTSGPSKIDREAVKERFGVE